MTGTAAPHGTTSVLPPPSANGPDPPRLPAPKRARRGPDRQRLSLGPATGRQTGAGIHGGWWPRSRDAAAELPGLIAELTGQAGSVRRVVLQADAFSNIPPRLDIGGRKVAVAWFRYMNKHTVILTMASRDDLVLLVIPPRASQEAATEALRLAASGRRVGPPEAILAAAGIAVGGGQGGAMDDWPAGDLDATEAQAADLLALARLDDDGAPDAGVLPRSQSAREADGNVEASGGDGGGVHGAAVHSGDR
jgi:Family of unknown function (DUF5994)